MMIAVLERLVYGLSKLQIPAGYQQADNSLLMESYNKQIIPLATFFILHIQRNLSLIINY